MQKKSWLIILALYLFSSVASYAAFSVLGKAVRTAQQVAQNEEAAGESPLSKLLTIDPNEPKDQVCPLNGKYFTKTEKAAWEKKRPLAVMIENTPDSRPQSGLSDADLVFEAVAEGGVTRFILLWSSAHGYHRGASTLSPGLFCRLCFWL